MKPHDVPVAPECEYHSASGADGTRIAYRDAGCRHEETLVFLHSLGADGGMWDACRALLPTGLRVVVPDTRGHGASGAAAAMSVDAWVADLDEVLSSASVERALLVGVSMGGIQALAFAARHPERVTGLVVADSFAALPRDVAERKIASLRDRARTAPMDVVAREYLAETFQEPYPPGAESVRRAISGMDSPSYRAAVETCFGADIEALLPDVVAPTLVLWGERDTKTPRHLSEAIAGQLRNARLSVVPDAGHLSNIDNPRAFLAEVTSFHQAGAPAAAGTAQAARGGS
jgi:3-oxoadipate enol-lactonase